MIPGVTAAPINPKRINGRIRLSPEDFVVAEVIKKGNYKEGHHLLAVAEKLNLDHLTIVKALGKQANYLGIKDKEAHAYFFLSFKRTAILLPAVPGLKIRVVGRTRQLLSRSALLGNAFKIAIRDCDCDEQAFITWKDILERWLCPNYYGPQRFAAMNHLIGRAIIRGDNSLADELIAKDGHEGLKAAPLWLKRLYVQAYQSYLFNLEVSKVIGGEVKGEVKTMAIDEGLFKGTAEVAYLPGYGFRDKGDAYSRALIEVMKSEGIKFRNFYVDWLKEVSQEGGIRPARIPAAKISYTIEKDKATVRFILRTGSYATSALRELLLEEA